MPPISKKKRVDCRFDPDTRRVFNIEEHDASDILTGQTHYQNVLQGRQRKGQPAKSVTDCDRINNPHPKHVSFLRQDVATLHQPICHVKTRLSTTKFQENDWWPSGASNEPLEKPQYSYDSTMRSNYQHNVAEDTLGLTRHGCNPNVHPAHGIVPVNRLRSKRGPRLLVEHISYEHGYDSRSDPNNPARGKRHGSFVWDVMHPDTPSSKDEKKPASSMTSSESYSRRTSLSSHNPSVLSSATSSESNSRRTSLSSHSQSVLTHESVTPQEKIAAQTTNADNAEMPPVE